MVYKANVESMCLGSQGGAGGGCWSAAACLGPPFRWSCCWPSRNGSSVLVLWWLGCSVWLYFVVLVGYEEKK